MAELVDFYVSGARSDWRYKDEGKVAYRVIMCVKDDPGVEWTSREYAEQFKKYIDEWTVEDWANALDCAAREGRDGVFRAGDKPRPSRLRSVYSLLMGLVAGRAW